MGSESPVSAASKCCSSATRRNIRDSRVVTTSQPADSITQLRVCRTAGFQLVERIRFATGPFCVLLIISFGYRFAVSTLTRYTTEGGKQRGRTVIGNDSFIGVDPAINSSSFRNGDQRAVGAILTH